VNDYPAGVKPLRGCVNDARKLQKTAVTHYGFRPENTLILTDEPTPSPVPATAAPDEEKTLTDAVNRAGDKDAAEVRSLVRVVRLTHQ
jgi:hypothetical protein